VEGEATEEARQFTRVGPFEAADRATLWESRFGAEVAGTELAEELFDGVVPGLQESLPKSGLEFVERVVIVEGGSNELLEKGREFGRGNG
jgi:hypothetical protein